MAGNFFSNPLFFFFETKITKNKSLFDREKCLLEFKKGFQMETFSSNLNDASQSQSDGV